MKRKFILLMTLMCIMGGLNLSNLFAQDNCDVIFTLKDSADNWGGGYLTVSYGSTSKVIKCDSKLSTETLSIPSGTEVLVRYTLGTQYPTWDVKENSFTIEYKSGELIVSAPEPGQQMVDGATYIFTVDCSPKAPVAPTLNAEVTSSSTIALLWNAVPLATHYNVYDGNGVVVAENIVTTNYTVQDLNANTNYCFTVKAENEVGESDDSNEVCATTLEEGCLIVAIGENDGTTTTSSPIYDQTLFYSSNRYTLSQTIYTQAEIGVNGGVIESIYYNQVSGNNNIRNISIYLKNIEEGNFSNETVVDLTDATCVYDGNYTFGKSGWIKIDFTGSFIYEGNNLLVCVIDNTGTVMSSGYDSFYVSKIGAYSSEDFSNCRSVYCTSNSTIAYDNIGSMTLNPLYNYSSNKFTIPQTKLFVSPAAAGIEVTPTSIALGDVRMGNYWTEKTTSSQDVEVEVSSTTVTSVECSNNFFTLTNIPAGNAIVDDFTFNVGYNKEANVTEPQNGTITIKWADGEDVTIHVSATPYEATAPDAIEVFTEVEFTDNAYTNAPTFDNLHDDYILPGEETDGNAPDAVYKFELTEDATLSASITGDGIENSYLAIYSEDFGAKDGPSSDNNNIGTQGGGSSAPTTFGPYTFDDASEDLKYFINSGWTSLTGYQYIYTTTEGAYIMTGKKIAITNNSELSFSIWAPAAGSEQYSIFISEDETFDNFDIIIKSGTCTSEEKIETSLKSYEGGNYYVGIVFTTKDFMLAIDNFVITDGSSKSRGLAPAIDAVQYPAGTYYLVAAADKAFTVNISTATVPAPEKAELTAPENNATEQDNPVLKWNAAQYATEYQVLLGTTNPPTEVVKDWTENIFSYQTEGLTNNTRYYWQVKAKNAKGESTSDVYSFVTTLDIPQITSEKEVEVFTDSEAPVITWNAIAGAKYNVYKDGVKLNALITETSYTLSDLTYNMTGSAYTVKAVYENLNIESSASETVNVKVSGYGDLTVTVKDGENAIKLASVVITGTDEFGNAVNYSGTTDENGVFAVVKVKVGSYTASASKFNYEDNDASVTVGHNAVAQTTITLQSVSLEADADVLSGVAAAEDGDDAKVTWRGANNNTQMYNVYRKNVDTDEVTSLVTNYNVSYNRTDEYTDAAYSELADGKYQYAVTTMVGVPEEVEIMKEGFDNGTLPTGWTYDNCWYPYSYDGNPPGCAYFYSNSSSVTGRLYTTIIDLTQNTTSKLTFDYKNVIGHQHANYFYVDVYSENGNRLKSQTVTGNAVASYTSYELSLNDYVGQKIRLCFRGYNYGWGCTYIDNVVVSGTRIKTVESSAVWSNEIKKGGIRFTNAAGDNKWETAGNWNTGVVPEDGSEVTIMAVATLSTHRTVSYLAIGGGSLTLNAGANLTVTGDLISDDVLGLYINDGAQLFHKSENVMATFNMDILNPTEWSDSNKDGWQFISSPFVTASVSDFTNSNTYVYDLYKYNGTADLEWDNYKDNNAAFGYEFVQGTGYLASYSTLGTATLKGELNATSSYTWEGLHNENGKDLANFHLLGNPFAFDMDWSKVSSEGLVEGYAVIDAENGSAYEYKTNGTIKLGDGFFVKTSADNASLSYTHSARGLRGERANSLNIIATSNAGKDNVIINLAGESDGFDKLQNFNDAVATVYVQNEGKNYGIYNCDENVQEVELQFNANKMGSYTISIEPDGKFESVTLVDRFTGAETNMLIEDYSFTAMSTDNNNRFIVKLKASGQKVEENDNFVYQNGEDLIVNGEGTVQIIDVMGRILYSNDVESTNGRIDVSNLNRATYIVRCINGNEVKSQKIVVL